MVIKCLEKRGRKKATLVQNVIQIIHLYGDILTIRSIVINTDLQKKKDYSLPIIIKTINTDLQKKKDKPDYSLPINKNFKILKNF